MLKMKKNKINISLKTTSILSKYIDVLEFLSIKEPSLKENEQDLMIFLRGIEAYQQEIDKQIAMKRNQLKISRWLDKNKDRWWVNEFEEKQRRKYND